MVVMGRSKGHIEINANYTSTCNESLFNLRVYFANASIQMVPNKKKLVLPEVTNRVLVIIDT